MALISTRSLASAAAVALVATMAPACLGDLQPHKEIDELRVLAMGLEPVDARPGQEVTATALIVDPSGADWTATWYACPVPVDAGQYFSGGFDTSGPFCDHPDHPYGIEVGTGSSAKFEVPETFLADAAALLGATGITGKEATSEAGEEPASLEDLVFFIGWHMRVVLVVERTDGTDRVEAHRRLIVTGLGGQHTNPAPPAIHMQRDTASREEDGTSVIEPPATTEAPTDGSCLVAISEDMALEQDTGYLLVPVNLPAEPEEYLSLTSEGEVETVEERYFFSWFTTTRTISEGMTFAGDAWVSWAVDTPDEEDLLIDDDGNPYLPLWVVVRDGRGGTAWCEQRLPYIETDASAVGGE